MAKNLFKFISAYLLVTIVLAIVYQPVIPFLGYTLDIPPFYIAVIIAVIALFIILYTFLNKNDGKAIKIGIALSFITVTVLTFFQFLLNTFYNGYISKYDIIDPVCGYLTNKWGRKVIPYKDYDFYALKDKKTYIFKDSYWDENDDIKIKLDVYQDQSGEFVLLSSVIMEYSNDESAQTIAQYIEKEYSKVVWYYQAESKVYKDEWGLDDPIVIVKKVDGSKSEPTEKSDDGYTDLGPIVCYECSNKDDKEDVPLSRDYDYHLYVKTYQGENFYFISKPDMVSKFPVTKGSWTKDGEHYNGKVDLIMRKGYVNISSWSSSGGSGSYNSSNNSGERTIRTESSPQPVQEWVPCPVCGNSGRLGLCQHCNGTGQDLYYNRSYRDCPNCGGLKKCTTCGGSGGHYETRYR